jgi:hypothetical protein
LGDSLPNFVKQQGALYDLQDIGCMMQRITASTKLAIASQHYIETEKARSNRSVTQLAKEPDGGAVLHVALLQCESNVRVILEQLVQKY